MRTVKHVYGNVNYCCPTIRNSALPTSLPIHPKQCEIISEIAGKLGLDLHDTTIIGWEDRPSTPGAIKVFDQSWQNERAGKAFHIFGDLQAVNRCQYLIRMNGVDKLQPLPYGFQQQLLGVNCVPFYFGQHCVGIGDFLLPDDIALLGIGSN